ncbi:MAG: hypothetical protein NVS3B21_03440 [Acidimicrobiales bacterium]
MPVALWVARLKHPKDPLRIVKEWPGVVAAVPEAQLIMCGEGPLASALKSEISGSPAASSIRYLGHVSDLENVYKQCSVYVLASSAEGGVNMAALEAMASGLVPILSDAGDARLVEAAHAGVVIRRNVPGAFSKALTEAFLNTERTADMRWRSIAFAHARTTEQMVSDTIHFYRRILDVKAG